MGSTPVYPGLVWARQTVATSYELVERSALALGCRLQSRRCLVERCWTWHSRGRCQRYEMGGVSVLDAALMDGSPGLEPLIGRQ
jgi:hypothetical protein